MILTLSKAKQCVLAFRMLARSAKIAQIAAANQHFWLDAQLPQLTRTTLLQLLCTSESANKSLQDIIHKSDDLSFLTLQFCLDKMENTSLYSSLQSARNNASYIRELVSTEVWEQINELFLWTNSISLSSSQNEHRIEFCERYLLAYSTIMGLIACNQPRDEIYQCIMLGTHLENAVQTLTLLANAQNIWLQKTKNLSFTPEEEISYSSLLLNCFSALDSFLRTGLAMTTENIFHFMTTDRFLPSSIRSTLEECAGGLYALQKKWNFSELVIKDLIALIGQLESQTLSESLSTLNSINTSISNAILESKRLTSMAGINKSLQEIFLVPMEDQIDHLPTNLFLPTLTQDRHPKLFKVCHESKYRYNNPVLLSKHLFRLQPVSDQLQTLVRYKLTLKLNGESVLLEHYNFAGAFGNHATFCEINQTYTELDIFSESLVSLYEAPSMDTLFHHQQMQIPLIWMPWDRIMMQAFLIPPELAESELYELSEYAMSFVKRNNNKVYDVLNDINQTIFKEYAYITGSTSLSTTPYEVYVNKRGVCQDFANLFICLARLLNVPARYRVGYIYTGTDYENKVQSDATHAWVEVYLPLTGWIGFDPTNGCLASKNHIRVACGRNYRDATPTSGTIYQGGGNESLSTSVRVIEVTDAEEEIQLAVLTK